VRNPLVAYRVAKSKSGTSDGSTRGGSWGTVAGDVMLVTGSVWLSLTAYAKRPPASQAWKVTAPHTFSPGPLG